MSAHSPFKPSTLHRAYKEVNRQTAALQPCPPSLPLIPLQHPVPPLRIADALRLRDQAYFGIHPTPEPAADAPLPPKPTMPLERSATSAPVSTTIEVKSKQNPSKMKHDTCEMSAKNVSFHPSLQ
mmetsp:Transcript_15636/g.21614  ORF Transcript_15636/g.21614 Transcript_15636/m.21614 type:complete len:125 (+) Transcript_15636:93-467(+)